ncbi:MAG: hypothetical protein RL885_17825, partial [Planctomycetota bacterium]
MSGRRASIDWAAIEGHLSVCPTCQRAIAELEQSPDPLVGLLRGPSPEHLPDPPAALLERA